jgi:hypothetical protein
MGALLAPIPWQPMLFLRPEALALLVAASARLGTQLKVQAKGAWRPYADQKYFRDLYLAGKGNPASDPDTGPRFHMRGAAFDLVRTDAAAQAACRAVGLVRDPAESWHWNHPAWASMPVIKTLAVAGLNIEEIDDMPSAEEVAKATVQELRNAVWFNGDAGGATDRFEAMIGKIRASVLKQEGAQVGYGTRVENIESLVTEVRELAAQTKLGINNTEDKVNFLGKVEFSAAEIAQLGSILAANVSKASDEELQRQAAAVADELKKRLAA